MKCKPVFSWTFLFNRIYILSPENLTYSLLSNAKLPKKNNTINFLWQNAKQKAILNKTQVLVEWYFWKSDGLYQLINGSAKN